MRRFLRLGICLLLILSVFTGMAAVAFAKSSSEIQKEIDKLKQEAKEIDKQKADVKNELNSINEEIRSFADKKRAVDEEIVLLMQQSENIDEQIHQYNLLIAEKQSELDTLVQTQADLFERYKLRMRAIQEQGDVSYMSVLLQANSFADMLNRLVMIEEIANADQRMIAEFRQMAGEVLGAKESLAAEKTEIELKKAELEQTKAELDSRRAEADQMLTELSKDQQKMKEEYQKILDSEGDLDAIIAQREKEYTEQKKREDEEKIITEKGFMFPVALDGFVYLSSGYKMRWHPITGRYTLHNGVDLASYAGTRIFASKSGVVTTSTYSNSWGNYVVINHGDGYSTLYGHMQSRAVKVGDVVKQGQVIGYVGSTGWSTGPHLHFTIYYNGSTVNPIDYINIP